jgi:hypothetical protein
MEPSTEEQAYGYEWKAMIADNYRGYVLFKRSGKWYLRWEHGRDQAEDVPVEDLRSVKHDCPKTDTGQQE